MDYFEALKIADAVFEQYKQDQPKWWRKMDGTPILNDVSVRMAKAFSDKSAVEATDLGAATAETRQGSPFGFYIDSIWGHGSRSG